MDVGKHTASCYGDASQQLVELLIVADSQLDVAGDDAVLLVVAGGVACQLENLSRYCSKVDWGSSANTLGILALLQVQVDTAHGKLEASLLQVGD